jgi:hypothetical protein
VDAVFARIGSDGTGGWYLPDHLGSIRGLMNNSGALIDALSYDAWANVTNETQPANGDSRKFAGYWYEALASLYYVRARWYNPAGSRDSAISSLRSRMAEHLMSRNPQSVGRAAGELMVGGRGYLVNEDILALTYRLREQL